MSSIKKSFGFFFCFLLVATIIMPINFFAQSEAEKPHCEGSICCVDVDKSKGEEGESNCCVLDRCMMNTFSLFISSIETKIVFVSDFLKFEGFFDLENYTFQYLFNIFNPPKSNLA